MDYRSVIFSGLPKSGKSTLAKKISEKIGWPLLSIGSIHRKRWQQKYPNKEITFEEYFRTLPEEENRKVNEDSEKTFEKGGVVGDFRYAAYYKKYDPLMIFVTADLQTRIERSERDGEYRSMSASGIKKILLQREDDEVRIGKGLFGFDYRNIDQYHIVLNSALLSVDQEFDAVMAVLKFR